MLLLTTTILQCPSERSNELISLWSKCNALRTIYRPSESISPKDFRLCFVVPAQRSKAATRLEQNTATRLKLWAIGYRVLAMGDGLLVIGYGLLVIGYWVLGIGYGLECATVPQIISLPFGRNLINLGPSRPPYKGGGLGTPKSIAFRFVETGLQQ